MSAESSHVPCRRIWIWESGRLDKMEMEAKEKRKGAKRMDCARGGPFTDIQPYTGSVAIMANAILYLLFVLDYNVLLCFLPRGERTRVCGFLTPLKPPGL